MKTTQTSVIAFILITFIVGCSKAPQQTETSERLKALEAENQALKQQQAQKPTMPRAEIDEAWAFIRAGFPGESSLNVNDWTVTLTSTRPDLPAPVTYFITLSDLDPERSRGAQACLVLHCINQRPLIKATMSGQAEMVNGATLWPKNRQGNAIYDALRTLIIAAGGKPGNF